MFEGIRMKETNDKNVKEIKTYVNQFIQIDCDLADIIKNSMVYDIALLYDWSNLGTIMLGELTVSNDRSAHTANVKNANSIAKYKLNPTIEQFKNPSAVQ